MSPNWNDHAVCRVCGIPKPPGICKPCQTAYRRRYYEDRKADALRVQASYYVANRDKVLAQHRDWERRNPDAVSARKSRRKALKHGSVGSYTAAEWRLIMARQRGKCALCRKRCKLTADHIIPLARGGSNLALNIQGLCGPCNSAKNAKELPQYNRSLFDRPVAS